MPVAPLIRWGAAVAGAVPGLWLLWQWHIGALGVIPDTALLHWSGRFALLLLMGTLGIGFAHFVTGWGVLFAARRPLGVWTFAYALAHAVVWAVYDQAAVPAFMIEEAARMAHVQLGIGALLLMTPLALTSVDAAQRAMTLPRWRLLHLLVWPAAALAVAHAWVVSRFDSLLVQGLAAALALLAVARLVALWRAR